MDKQEVLELLSCALINCDNIRHLGPVSIEIVKAQIQSAIDLIEEQIEFKTKEIVQ